MNMPFASYDKARGPLARKILGLKLICCSIKHIVRASNLSC